MAPPDRLPNFLIAGVPNAGTTSLYFYLRQHPQIYMSPVKEPTFFGVSDFLAIRYPQGPPPRPGKGRGSPRITVAPPAVLEWGAYQELFRKAKDEVAIGEGSVTYFWLPSAAREIHARLPDARLIFMLRDPAERLFARYQATFWSDSPESFRSRFLAATDPGDVWGPAVTVGRYATNLERFFGLFPRDHIRVHLYEDYRADPRTVLRDIFEFLGVDPESAIDLSRRHNESFVPRFPALEALRRRFLQRTSVTRWLPTGAREALRRIYHRPRPDRAMDPADRRLVIDYYRDEILRTAALIGRDLSAWLR